MVDLGVELAGLRLDNPVIPSSGTFGYGEDYAGLYDLNILGSIALKGTTAEPRRGNPLPRIAECEGGMLNSIGLQNPGVDAVADELLPALKAHFNKKVIANACGFSTEEYVYVAKRFDACDNVGLIELNVSCPNVSGRSVGGDPNALFKLVSEVRKHVSKPLLIKLSPLAADLSEIAAAAIEGGADGFTLINSPTGMRIDPVRRSPVLANGRGGMSGKMVFPLALRAVYDVYSRFRVPVIGVGGISSAEDVVEMMLAGAAAVEVGAANLVDPFACKKIIESRGPALERFGFSSAREVVGLAAQTSKT